MNEDDDLLAILLQGEQNHIQPTPHGLIQLGNQPISTEEEQDINGRRIPSSSSESDDSVKSVESYEADFGLQSSQEESDSNSNCNSEICVGRNE